MADKRIRMVFATETGKGPAFYDNVHARLTEMVEEDEIQAEVNRRSHMIDDFGEDDHPEGTVFTFQKQHDDGGPKYSYAVIKANGYWFTTGAFARRADWTGLVLWLVSGKFPVAATELKLMVPATSDPISETS